MPRMHLLNRKHIVIELVRACSSDYIVCRKAAMPRHELC